VAASGGAALTSPYLLAGSTTLYAQWTANATDTITFNSEGGSAVTSMSGLDGTTITLPTAPTYAGHSFNGWFVAPSGGAALTSPYLLAGSTTLYAQWTANSYTVTFNSNGGTGTMANETHNTLTALTTNAFTRTGYTFTGWNTLANGHGTAYANGATYPFTALVTLYAQWKVQFTVTFNANGGTGTMARETESAPTALTLNTFTRTGYTFTGWNTAANGHGTAYANGATYPFTASVTLYAQWMPKSRR